MRYDIIDAIKALAPNARWSLKGSEYSGLTWVDGGGDRQPSLAEIDAKINELHRLEPMKLLREERNRRIKETDWRASSDLTISDEWRTYRQALRDLPSTSTPTLDSNYELDMTSVNWPTEPS